MTPSRDLWAHLRQHTTARIALGRTGVSLPTRELLDFALAHAQARDAIHLPLDTDRLSAELQQQGWPAPLLLHSQARDRHEYLLRPDLGRRLDAQSVTRLVSADAESPDLVLVLGDGLSALGIQQHGAALLGAIRRALDPAVRLGPLVVVRQARVAVADEVGERLGAAAVAMVVGERPGLSSPDSVGIYLTRAPRVGCSDAQRNCISNVRPAGQDLDTAARRLAWLLGESRRLGLTGVGLKDHSGLPLTGLPANPEHVPGLN
ncbi:ethanolamine ammonia-lyase subunit EutC [Hydrogenophaga sp. PBL-H3]|uniref:ethanolamine ammonia-lyase subunit EutC n=1 Tax=Hydrogenophaga sp. PBL-H3 TaxID=434010 RepID=UPI00131FD10C|nr:ethanolamine ammonia-lyase subunit EutC [Hydrogenophaga sp. PBL-H3]QHE74939.1 ethanolamine ammonia-lyase subunit EutC [Hydrogenophaga sp. PBL-H3]QHE79366.1 ethanolamine ammonia-lyase subunit EutC [Hydrogenophaga sp. PBL-H3]